MYERLATKLSSPVFSEKALEELKDLSEALSPETSQSVSLIKGQLDIFNTMSGNPCRGPFYKTACEAAQQGAFNGVKLQRDSRQRVIDPRVFDESLCKSRQTKMVTK